MIYVARCYNHRDDSIFTLDKLVIDQMLGFLLVSFPYKIKDVFWLIQCLTASKTLFLVGAVFKWP